MTKRNSNNIIQTNACKVLKITLKSILRMKWKKKKKKKNKTNNDFESPTASDPHKGVKGVNSIEPALGSLTHDSSTDVPCSIIILSNIYYLLKRLGITIKIKNPIWKTS